ncbi:hypothetical protein CJ030_MR7G000163 [Morella rubra]|uniref:Uncharacterized protein n=1 Tax=Morella rubra TaxID=262757 RepID=A0A6A1V691_9ROSI|nr:hypothetical protein CJ030_MR7G000165 [Morella rubra]KAB1208283.1 hypothetical protein CJ030_MR7G000163 [Morella rubra]
MDDRPLEERLQAADMDYLTFRSISIGFIVDVTPVLGGMMVGGKVLDHWLHHIRPNQVLITRTEQSRMQALIASQQQEIQALRDQIVSSFSYLP